MERWSKLKDALIQKRAELGESQTLQQFSRDAEEIETWMLEKLQLAQEENYKVVIFLYFSHCYLTVYSGTRCSILHYGNLIYELFFSGEYEL